MRAFTEYVANLALRSVVLVTLWAGCTAGDNVASNVTPTDLAAYRLPDSTDFSAIPQDPKNPITAAKVALGKMLFHDPTLLGAPKRVEGLHSASCASCHHAQAGFQAGVRQGLGEGGVGFGSAGAGRHIAPGYDATTVDVQPIRSPSALNVAYFTNILWNGQFGANGVNGGTNYAWTPGTPKETNTLGFDGVETQAIAGQTVHRLKIDQPEVRDNAAYQALCDAAYASPTLTVVEAGLAIAAYERTLLANRAPFQRWLRGDTTALSAGQQRGMALFFGKAQCDSCHNSPALGGMEFSALGMGDLLGGDVVASDASKAEHRGRGGFTGNATDNYKFKVPGIYNLKGVEFLGHGGTLHSVREVVEYKNRAVIERAIPSSQVDPRFVPLGLHANEIDDLVDFIENGLYDPDLARYQPTQAELPTHRCPIDDDSEALTALGCTAQH